MSEKIYFEADNCLWGFERWDIKEVTLNRAGKAVDPPYFRPDLERGNYSKEIKVKVEVSNIALKLFSEFQDTILPLYEILGATVAAAKNDCHIPRIPCMTILAIRESMYSLPGISKLRYIFYFSGDYNRKYDIKLNNLFFEAIAKALQGEKITITQPNYPPLVVNKPNSQVKIQGSAEPYLPNSPNSSQRIIYPGSYESFEENVLKPWNQMMAQKNSPPMNQQTPLNNPHPLNRQFNNEHTRQTYTTLRCPTCDAPLSKSPPCKCDYCGVLIH